MCKGLEKQKIKTQFQFNDVFLGEQTHEFEHTVLEPQNLQREIETVRQREDVIQGLRAAIYSQALPARQAQQVVRPAERQPAEPVAVREKNWKERQAERKEKARKLKRGKKLTQYGDELTADLVEKQQALDENVRSFRDFGYTRDDISEELVDVLRSMENVRITADMLTDETYVSNYTFLRETVEKGKYLARIAGSESHMEKLRKQDFSLYRTALYWKGAVSLVEQMMTFTNITHGLDQNARVIEDPQEGVRQADPLKRPEAIGEAREKINTLRDQFRDAMAAHEQAYRETVLNEEYEEELARLKNDRVMTGTEEERGWLQSPSLAYGSGEAYASLQELKTLIEGSNELYIANKVIVDRMYSDIIRRHEVLGELAAQKNTWLEIQSRYQHYQNHPGSDGNKLWRETNSKLDKLITDGTAVAENLSTLTNALTRLLEGKLFNPIEVATLESYGYHAAADMEVATAPLRERATARAVRNKWQGEALDRFLGTEEHPGVFRPADPNSVYVTRTVTLFKQGDDAYNLELLETLQPFEKELNRKRPVQTKDMSDERFEELKREDTEHRQEYYEKVLKIVEPQVARIMTWEMDRYLQMSDTELIGAQKELDDLFGANMFTADLMKLKHPEMESRQMKEDILGDRLEEFSHRLAVLRALTDKSRGLALQKLGEQTILKPEYFGTDAAYGKLGDGSHDSCMAFAKKQIEAGERMLANEQARWTDKRVTDKLKKLSFDQFPQRTKGMEDGRTRFLTGWHRRDGLERGEYKAPSDRIGLVNRVADRFRDQKRYGDVVAGGVLEDLGNATGIRFTGLKAKRVLANLEGALGQGCTEEQITAMYEKLMATGRYRWLKCGESLNTLTEEEVRELKGYDAMKVKALDDTFAEGFQELKQIYLAQLRRIREKYGRFGSQLHPEDFARRMGLEFFDDFMLGQDMAQMLKDGQQYFDFENSAEDREFRDLVNYYSSVFNILFTYFSVPEDQYDFAMTVILPNLKENQTARDLEDVVGGDGFTVQEQEAYRQDLAKRAGKQKIQLFGRFKGNA